MTRWLFRRRLGLAAAALSLAGAAGCCRWAGENSAYLNGAGSTFVFPVMSRWAAEFNRIDPRARVNYQSIGSGGGIRQLIRGTVHFGATDGPMTDAQLREAGRPVVHIPLVLGAVVPTYNLPPLAHPIRFTPEALAAVFLGHVTSWNDPLLAEANPDLALPATPLVVVHRSDGSGTTYVWTDYLARVSPEWKQRVGNATSVNWPVGLGGRGNEGVAGTVRQTPGAIGYVELTYAIQNGMPAAHLRNHDGAWVAPSLEAVTAAAASAIGSLPDDLRYSLADAPGAASWPASATTWGLVYQDMAEGPRREALISFLRWVLTDGQRFCESLHYAPLPAELASRALAKLDTIGPQRTALAPGAKP